MDIGLANAGTPVPAPLPKPQPLPVPTLAIEQVVVGPSCSHPLAPRSLFSSVPLFPCSWTLVRSTALLSSDLCLLADSYLAAPIGAAIVVSPFPLLPGSLVRSTTLLPFDATRSSFSPVSCLHVSPQAPSHLFSVFCLCCCFAVYCSPFPRALQIVCSPSPHLQCQPVAATHASHVSWIFWFISLLIYSLLLHSSEQTM